MKFNGSILFLLTFCLLCAQCGHKQPQAATTQEGNEIEIPSFDADSAKTHIDAQCAWGPRVTGTEAHRRCAEYIEQNFARYGYNTQRQEVNFVRYDGVTMPGSNLIATSAKQKENRILIAAHYDSRPWADQDANPANHRLPVMAANDGASGVAVMLELARQLALNEAPLGVDFVCFDAEDVGVPKWNTEAEDNEDTWCLGAQYWARHPHADNYRYGILLDMVGGQGAHFYRERYSMRYAAFAVERVWQAAREAGYSSQFPREDGGFVTDDHVFVNRIARLPMIDIVPFYPTGTSSFGPTWHTVQDTPENIDLTTLKAVGQTLLQLIYTEHYDH